MSTGGPTPPRKMTTGEWLKRACVFLVCAYIGVYFLIGWLGIGSCEKERLDPQKMSHVTVPPQTPIWVRQPPQPIVIFGSNPAPAAQPVRQRVSSSIRIPSWDEDWEPYAVWLAKQQRCKPDRPQ